MGAEHGKHRESATLARWRRKLQAESGDGIKLFNDLKDNPICSVFFDPEIGAVTVIWKRYASSTQLRFIHERIIDLALAHGASRIIGDDTALPTIHADDQKWILDDWMPRAIAAGLRTAASKSPAAYFGRLAVASVQSSAPAPIVIRAFDSLDDARAWLQTFTASEAGTPIGRGG